MELALLLFWFTVSNRYIRGVDESVYFDLPAWVGQVLNKGTWAFLSGALIGFLYGDLWLALTVFAGLWLWAGPGWTLLALHGDGDTTIKPEYEAVRARWYAKPWLWYNPSTKEGKRLFGALCMATRGLLILPLFLAIAHPILFAGTTPSHNTHIVAAVYGLACAAIQGFCYWFAGLFYRQGENNYNWLAEMLMGANLAGWLWVML